jgi:hypothetical protein
MTRRAAVLRSLLLLIAAGGLCVRQTAQAQPASAEASRQRLLFATANSSDPVVLRVAAELRSQGFLLVQVTAEPATMGEEQMKRVARASRAVAAVRLTTSGSEVTVWAADLVRNRDYLHAIPLDDDPTITSLRAVEALRSRITDLLALAPAPPPAAPAVRAPAAAPAPKPARHALGLIAGAARSRGWPAWSWQIAASWRWAADATHSAESLVMLPVRSARVPAGNGSAARLSPTLLAVGYRWQPTQPSSAPLIPSFGVGPGVVRLHASADSTETHVASSRARTCFAPYTRVGLGFATADALHLRADLWAVFTVPATQVLVHDDTIGSWGRPVGIGTAGLEAHWR